MKNLLCFPLILLGAALPAAASLPNPAPMKVHDLASGFSAVWERNEGKSDAAFIQDFKTSVAARLPGFYGAARFNGRRSETQRDADLARARAEFPAMRAAYAQKVERFTRQLPGHIASFRTAFPDYPATTDVWFLHSLGESEELFTSWALTGAS